MPEAAALLALWNDVDPALDAEYDHWHAHEHVPERLTVPGMLWGRRYRREGAAPADAGMPRYLTLYGLRAAAVLDSEPYLKLLREPTAMSRRMRPELLRLSRWVCDLQMQGDADAGSHLAVSTFAANTAKATAKATAQATAQAAASESQRALGRQWRGQLLAQRRPEASALPWLQAAQAGGVRGEVLLCTSFESASVAPVVPAGSTRFERLR